MSRHPQHPLPAAAALVLALLVPAACGSGAGTDTDTGTDPSRDAAGAAGPRLTWAGGPVAPLSLVSGTVELDAPADEVRVALDGARVTSIPEVCTPSTVTRTTSAIVGADLVCAVGPDVEEVEFTAVVVGSSATLVTGQVTARSGIAVRTSAVVAQAVTGLTPSLTPGPAPGPAAGPAPALAPDLRLLSSPDFLNGDVGDLADGPGSWADQRRGDRTTNSTNRAYERALDVVLDDWEALDPAGVLVGGDLTDGRWGYDDTDSGNFGPVDTPAQQRRALRRAARTYYPQWRERFTERGLTAFPAMGDHEYGDDPWPRRKRALAATFRSEFARAFTTDAAGDPLFADHPRGPARLTAYAGRPSPDVQVVTLDVFDITPARARIGLDDQQLRWLRGVLAAARRDRVEWVVVQGHTPILQPVRTRASSGLAYPGGRDSRLWRLFERYGVDLYLTGEVHDTTANEADGIVQISHGGIFHLGLTTALLLDFYGDRLRVTLRDYDLQPSEHPDGRRLWETRRSGMPFGMRAGPVVSTLGTATILGDRVVGAAGRRHRLSLPSGVLVPILGGDRAG